MYRAPVFFALLGLGAGLLLSVGGCQQTKRLFARRTVVEARHLVRAQVQHGRDIVAGNGHVLAYRQLKIARGRRIHNRQYTYLYLRVQRLTDLPLRRAVALPDAAVAVSGFVAVTWPDDVAEVAGTVTRLSADTVSPTLKLRVQYASRGTRRFLRGRVVFRADTAYFRRQK